MVGTGWADAGLSDEGLSDAGTADPAAGRIPSRSPAARRLLASVTPSLPRSPIRLFVDDLYEKRLFLSNPTMPFGPGNAVASPDTVSPLPEQSVVDVGGSRAKMFYCNDLTGMTAAPECPCPPAGLRRPLAVDPFHACDMARKGRCERSQKNRFLTNNR
ncbi:hypothetical protein [uncultured Methylobacterium sp.]|uniref:hypothetical protein n=1 Tax=uncultured Methylobacterium sp. TaxID=157278 RepID=UPI00259A8080|nr:hypothetical protein [uncultured Methylobacterium sp.]